jgi:hypothetical protein
MYIPGEFCTLLSSTITGRPNLSFPDWTYDFPIYVYIYVYISIYVNEYMHLVINVYKNINPNISLPD